MGLDFGNKTRLKQSMLDHKDCDIEIAFYGDPDNPTDVTLECISCGMVLMSCEDFEDSAMWDGSEEEGTEGGDPQ